MDKNIPLQSHFAPLMVLVVLMTSCTGDQLPENNGNQTPPEVETYIIDLRADVNRDGKIDSSDDNAAQLISEGVLVLPNLDDDSGRCNNFKVTQNGIVQETDDFVFCNDATDDISNGIEDIADLSIVELTAGGTIPDAALVNLSIVDSGDSASGDSSETQNQKWRLLVESDDIYVSVANKPVTIEQLRQGIKLAVEATDVVRSATQWTGKAQLLAELKIGDQTYRDQIPLMVTPIITQHDLGTIEKLFASPPASNPQASTPLSNPPNLNELGMASVAARFISNMNDTIADMVDPIIVLDDAEGDIWAQDYFEPGFVARPNENGVQSMRIMLRSANLKRYSDADFSLLPQFSDLSYFEIAAALEQLSDDEYWALYDQAFALSLSSGFREAGIALYSQVRGRDVAIVQIERENLDPYAYDSFNSTGNFTTSPPVNSQFGLPYAMGRMIYGSTPNPRFISLLKSQIIQNPIRVPTEWLSVGHVDEFITFLPSSQGRGWVIGVADPELAYQLLQSARDQSSSALKAFAGAYSLVFADGRDSIWDYQTPVDDILADENLKAANQLAISQINEALAILKQELNLSDDDIVRFPVLYQVPNYIPFAPGSTDIAVTAYFPNSVNGVYLGGYTFISPKQFGPVVNGDDVLQKAVEQALAPHGVSVRWVEDFAYAHLGEGNIHCVTNTHRDLSDVEVWWQ